MVVNMMKFAELATGGRVGRKQCGKGVASMLMAGGTEASVNLVGRSFGQRSLLLGAVALGALAFASDPASAQCAPDNPGPNGRVICTGFDPDGFTGVPGDQVSVLVNTGATVQGAAAGVELSGPGVSILDNQGAIQGNSGVAVRFNGTPDSYMVLRNGGTLNGGFVGSGDGWIVVEQNGMMNGGVTITGDGRNDLTIFRGKSISGLVDITGAENRIDNAGVFNNGLVLTGRRSNVVVNRAGAQVSGVFTITGDGQNTVLNGGTLNNGLVLTGNGSSFIVNQIGGVISGDLVSNGSAKDFLDNYGVINNAVRLGAGDDVVLNRADGSGGTIQGTIDLGDGKDQLYVFGGVINGQVLLGAGDDLGVVEGGLVSSTIQTQAGRDLFVWRGGSIGGLDMGTENDIALFEGLDATELKTGLRIDGGLGDDVLWWTGTRGDDVARYVNWELIGLASGSEMTFSNFSTLTLGDSGSGTGALYIAPGSTVFAGGGTHTVSPFAAGRLVTVSNGGLIDLTNAAVAATDRFVVNGSYHGFNGFLGLHTVLESDNAPSDRLEIRGTGAVGDGRTWIRVTNLNGLGDLTVADGIPVVLAQGGAITSTDAFALDGIVAAGMFEYLLYRGGVSAGSENNWYLRSQLLSPPPPPPPPPVGPITPTIRPETPNYSLAPVIGRELGLAALGTFHLRQGDQALLVNRDPVSGAWGRAFGEKREQGSSQVVSGTDFDLQPNYDGDVLGFQVGLDLVSHGEVDDDQWRLGVNYSHVESRGDVRGNTLARRDHESGTLHVEADYVGANLTYIDATGWYVDGVAMYGWLDMRALSLRGIGADLEGTSIQASLETGYPVRLGSSSWTLEPQAQVVWQRTSMDDAADRFSVITFEDQDSWTGRLGLRLEGVTCP